MLTEEKFNTLIMAYMDMVYRIALNCLREPSTAEDVCQEVFLRLLKTSMPPEGEEHCRHWLVRVTLNECRRVLISPWRRLQGLEATPQTYIKPEDDTLELVMSLNKKYRIVIYLYYYEGYSTKEIAKLLKRPETTVRSQLDRGRKQLKQMLLEAENG